MSLQQDEVLAPTHNRPWMYEHRRPSVTATVVVFDASGNVLVGRRKNAPHAGLLSLPGGFLNATEETTKDCALRELREETGLNLDNGLKLFHVSSNPLTDPRGHVVNVCYWRSLITEEPVELSCWDDLTHIQWLPIAYLQKVRMAFDHIDIIERAFDARLQHGLIRGLVEQMVEEAAHV